MWKTTELTKEELELVRSWRIFQDKVVTFQNKANLSLFQEIYGKEEGERLINHFVNRCDKDFTNLKTFLNKDQYNNTLIYILRNITL